MTYEYYLIMGYNPNDIQKIMHNLTVPINKPTK
jgi:hypothetical protein